MCFSWQFITASNNLIDAPAGTITWYAVHTYIVFYATCTIIQPGAVLEKNGAVCPPAFPEPNLNKESGIQNQSISQSWPYEMRNDRQTLQTFAASEFHPTMKNEKN